MAITSLSPTKESKELSKEAAEKEVTSGCIATPWKSKTIKIIVPNLG